MATVKVFDPPMCCSTGVCGPSVDPALAAFAADLSWLSDQGVRVERHSLSQEPGAFAERAELRALLAEQGDGALPVVMVDGVLLSSGRYPSRNELAAWALRGSSSGALDPATAELVAIGAALGANCEPCLTYHFDQASRLGVGSKTMVEAVRVAQTVKDVPVRAMLELAAGLLGTSVEALRPGSSTTTTSDTPPTIASRVEDGSSGCCGGTSTDEAPLVSADAGSPGSSGCCG